MLSLSQKATILVKVGIEVPLFPERRLPVQERYLREGARIPPEELAADREQRLAALEWGKTLENLFASYTAARAAKGLREAEQAQSIEQLREANASATLLADLRS